MNGMSQLFGDLQSNCLIQVLELVAWDWPLRAHQKPR